VALHDEAYPAGAIVQQATAEAAAMDLTIRSDNASPP
ncbi:Dihydrolipoamide acyltransferase, partial [Giardia duodenalis]